MTIMVAKYVVNTRTVHILEFILLVQMEQVLKNSPIEELVTPDKFLVSVTLTSHYARR